MPLVVPILRFFVVFLNVYETFKTLKPPPPSARRGGKPSARAISQRKRDLKGCLAVWVVWCCYAAYERTFDRVIAIFLPFYSEIKSVFLLFLVLTRAKGAEPLFLHVLRPLVKPYVAIMDPLLEISCDIGDFIFALLQVPLDYFLSSYWVRLLWRADSDAEEESAESSSGTHVDSGSSAHTDSRIATFVDQDGPVQISRAQSNRYESVHSTLDYQRTRTNGGANSAVLRDRYSKSASTLSLPAYSEDSSQAPPQYSQTLYEHSAHQIWYPPTSVHTLSNREMHVASPDPGITPEYHSSEWRTYPAFPSAYPPTPLPPSASLPSSVRMGSDNDDHHISISTYSSIPEDRPGFGKALECPRSGQVAPIRRSLNDHAKPPMINIHEECCDTVQQPDEDTLLDDSMCSSETGLSEDDFGASLRTPLRPPEVMLSSACSSVDNLTRALTTAENAPLRARNLSDSSSSGSSSLAGRKRTHGTFQGRTRNTLPTTHSRNATLRGRPAPLPILGDPLQSSTSEGEDESKVGGDYNSIKAKRQRVLEPVKRNSILRPAAREIGNIRETRSAARGQATTRARGGSTTTNNATIKGRKTSLASQQTMRGVPQGVSRSTSTSSSHQPGTLRGRA